MSAGALWTSHRPLARRIARSFNWPGAEPEDVEQEALIALWEAASTYDPGQGTAFKTFASIVVNNHLADTLRHARTGKHRPLNDSVRVFVLDGETGDVASVLPHLHQVSDRVEEREDLRRLFALIALLPEEQRYVVLGVASGLSYAQMGGNPKQIDNRLYKARRTLREGMAA